VNPYRIADPTVLAVVAAALTDRHIRADGYCSETHYPEAERLVDFIEGRGLTLVPTGDDQ
jgi:hypothetical protein